MEGQRHDHPPQAKIIAAAVVTARSASAGRAVSWQISHPRLSPGGMRLSRTQEHADDRHMRRTQHIESAGKGSWVPYPLSVRACSSIHSARQTSTRSWRTGRMPTWPAGSLGAKLQPGRRPLRLSEEPTGDLPETGSGCSWRSVPWTPRNSTATCRAPRRRATGHIRDGSDARASASGARSGH